MAAVLLATPEALLHIVARSASLRGEDDAVCRFNGGVVSELITISPRPSTIGPP
jgi:hypothetical protein